MPVIFVGLLPIPPEWKYYEQRASLNLLATCMISCCGTIVLAASQTLSMLFRPSKRLRLHTWGIADNHAVAQGKFPCGVVTAMLKAAGSPRVWEGCYQYWWRLVPSMHMQFCFWFWIIFVCF